jgi:F-type H+-transporting ATPase subunit gamma
MSIYDDVDEELLRCYHEITLANLIYYGLKEGACSEQSARMTAMDAASKNASIILLWLDLCGLTYIR